MRQGRFTRHRKTPGFVGAAILGAAAAVAWMSVASARRRRRQIARGEIAELDGVWSRVDGCLMYARTSAHPPQCSALPIVLVHGFGISSSYFVPTAEILATDFEVYAPDLPGHGRSDTPAEPLGIRQLADALKGWMDARGMRRAAIVANSMGCQVAVDLAVRYPERVDRLVLIGPTIDPAARSILQHAPRMALSGLHERRSITLLVVSDYRRMGTRLLSELRLMFQDAIETKLPLVMAPTMLVRGEYDRIVPQSWLDEAARLVRAERVAVIPGWGHAVNYSAPRELVAAIRPFLRQESLTHRDGNAPQVAPAR